MTRLSFNSAQNFNPRKPVTSGPYRNQAERRVLNQPKRSR
jgi:hypothetical protein